MARELKREGSPNPGASSETASEARGHSCGFDQDFACSCRNRQHSSGQSGAGSYATASRGLENGSLRITAAGDTLSLAQGASDSDSETLPEGPPPRRGLCWRVCPSASAHRQTTVRPVETRINRSGCGHNRGRDRALSASEESRAHRAKRPPAGSQSTPLRWSPQSSNSDVPSSWPR